MSRISAVAVTALLVILTIGITAVSSSASSSSSSDSASSLPAAFRRPAFHSRAWKHIEHVEWYQLDHEDRHLYNTKSVHRGEGLLSHVTYPYASRRMHTYEGMQLHFPTRVMLSVKALGQTFHLDLHLITELKSAETEVIAGGERHPVVLSSYRTIPRAADDIRAIVTFRRDGSFQALLVTPDEVIGIDPVEAHRPEMTESHYHSMATSAPHGMIAYKYSDFRDGDENKHECGVIHEPSSTFEQTLGHAHADVPPSPLQARRHLLQTTAPYCTGSNGENVPCRWLTDGTSAGTPCWTGITATNVKSMTVGVVADYGFAQIWGSASNQQTMRDNTIAALDQTYAVVNSVYVPQFGIFNKLMSYVVMTAGTGSAGAGTLTDTKAGLNYNWNQQQASAGTHCDTTNPSNTIDQYLNDLTSFNQADTNSAGQVKFAERHAHTNCYPAPGTVGLAWVGTIASKSGQGCGVSSYTSTHYLTVAHEQGHNLGGLHTFGPDGTDPNSSDSGHVGGIMDYTQTGQYPMPPAKGIVQFHPLSQPKICPQLKASMTDTSQYITSYFAAWTPTCGNGILEPGEACDDTSGCCDLSSCQLVAGAQCTPGKLSSPSPCCDTQCLYRNTHYGCPGGNSYCLFGKCANDGCTKYSNTAQCPASTSQYTASSTTYPGIGYKDGCNFGCSFSGSGCPGGTTQPSSFGSVPDGAVCSTPTIAYGTCSGGGSDGTGTSATCKTAPTPVPPTLYTAGSTQTPTQAPPTAAPTTAPTTPVPTTKAPTTKAPTTKAPATTAPTSTGTSTTAPTTVAPTTAAPTTAPTTPGPTIPPDVYSWFVASAWSTCFDSTGVTAAKCNIAGTQYRTVICRNSAGTQVSNTYCTAGTQPPTSQPCTGTCSYSWYADDKTWGTCNYNCSTPTVSPTQTRPIYCYEDGDTTHQTPLSTDPSTGPCSSSVPPASVRPCPNLANCTVSLVIPAFGAVCSKDCGGGTTTRTISCVYTQNGKQMIVPTGSAWATFQSQCAAKLAACTTCATSQACNTQNCTTYTWSASNFGACSASCAPSGGPLPTQTRTVACVDSAAGTPVASTLCTGTAPVSSQTCNTAVCPNYQWVITPATGWGSCSKTCGGGVQTRSVVCQDLAQSPALTVDDNTCVNSAKPPSQQTCNTQLCPSYAWRTTDFTVCSASCGGGTQTRTVECYDQNSAASPQPAVDSSLCPASSKPATTQACSTQACPTYTWLTGDYGSCSVPCGTGTQTRPVNCVQTGALIVVADSQCSGTKPATTAQCNTSPCPTYTWQAGAWSSCSATCAGGTRTRTLTCVDSNSLAAVATALCGNVTQPVTTDTCNTNPCATQWLAGAWGQCSKSCGVGTQTRSITCVYKDSQQPTGDDTLCTSTPPTTSAACNTFDCPSYRAGSWGPCTNSRGCGDGTQTRPLTCWDYTGTQVDISQCATASAPASSQVCSMDPCPHWHRDPWGDCSQPCGGGMQYRTLTCRMPHDNIWNGQKATNVSLCPDINVSGADGDPSDTDTGLITQKACNTDPCATYYWNTTYSACSVSCGGGTQTATSVCMSRGVPANNSASCLDPQPASSRDCNTYQCPHYMWKARAWSNCSVSCGVGIQTREVYCANVAANAAVQQETVNNTYCQQLGLPILPATQSCSISATVCEGANPSVSIDGRCDLNPSSSTYGQCVCRYGYGGAYCSIAPSIFGVTTDAGRVGSGSLPIHDTLLIQWQTTGNIPNVSIVLGQQGGYNPISSYLIVTQPFQNTATWTVGTAPDGSDLKGLKAGCGYYITVFAIHGVSADSAPFCIGDPCAVKSCVHGVCSAGVCTCDPAFSGDACDVPKCTAGTNCYTGSGTCVTTQQPSGSFCQCNAGWTGVECGTPTDCHSTCGVGGDLAPVAMASTSSIPTCPSNPQCVCLPGYSFVAGSGCTCNPGCGAYGVANSDCTGCTCVPGWFGAKCDRLYWTLRTQFILSSGFSFIQDSASKNAFGTTVSTDLAIAGGLDPARLVLDSVSISGPTTAIVTLRLLSVTATSHPMITHTTSHTRRSAGVHIKQEHIDEAERHAAKWLQASGLTATQITQIAELKQAYAQLAASLSDLQSYAWNGVSTYTMDPSYQMTLADPSGASGPIPTSPPVQVQNSNGGTSSSSSSNTLIIIIAAAVAGGVVALIILGMSIWLCTRHTSNKTTWVHDTKRLEMQSFDAFHNGNGVVNNNNNTNTKAWTASPAPASATTPAPAVHHAASNVGYTALDPSNTTSTFPSGEGRTNTSFGTTGNSVAAIQANPLTLPPGWSQQFTNDGTPYYFNALTSQTQWERPTA